MPRLIIIRGPEQGKTYELTADTVTIGRGRKNDIIIRDNEVSREHCRLVRVLNQYEIHDLGSSNGTFVNGHPVDERGWLADSLCIIELGESVTLEYHPDESPSESDLPSVTPATTQTQYFLLVKLASEAERQIYPLDSPNIRIGRGLDNDIVIQAPEMSRQHMRLSLSTGGYTLQDLNSLNGTLVNGERLHGSTLLKINDIITVGTSVEIQFAGKSIDTSPLSVSLASTVDDTAASRPTQARRSQIEEDQRKTSKIGHGLSVGDLEGNVFLAYAPEDWTPIVNKIFTRLQENKVPVWVDQYLKYGSDEWRRAIDQAMVESALLVVIVSPQAIKREHVIRSLRHFLNREKPIILFHYQDVVERLPLDTKEIPAIWYNPALPDNALQKLVTDIKPLLG